MSRGGLGCSTAVPHRVGGNVNALMRVNGKARVKAEEQSNCLLSCMCGVRELVGASYITRKGSRKIEGPCLCILVANPLRTFNLHSIKVTQQSFLYIR